MQPSVKMLGTTGSVYIAAGAVTGLHTFHNKSISTDVGSTLMLADLAMGGVMIGRAVWMHRKKSDDKKSDTKKSDSKKPDSK